MLASALALGSGLLIPGIATAKADPTPNTSALAGVLKKQKLTWEECAYPSVTDPNTVAKLKAVPNTQCASVTVPMDWHNPSNGKTISIRISQTVNSEIKSSRHKGTIFVNPGGPGGSGIPWAAAMTLRAVDLAPYYNFVGFDPRGVGESTALECTYTQDPNATPVEDTKAQVAGCQKNELTKFINTEQTAYDMDFIRALLGEKKLSYIGYSYGTWLGTWYGNVFGKNLDKILLDSSTNTTLPTLQKTWDLQPIARDRQFRQHFLPYMARHDDLYHSGTDPEKIWQNYQAAGGTKAAIWIFAITGVFGAFSDNSLYPDFAEITSIFTASGEKVLAGEKAAPKLDTDAQVLANAKAVLNQAATSPEVSPTLQQKAASGAKAIDGYLGTLQQKAKLKAPGLAEAQVYEPVFDAVRCQDGQWTQGANYWTDWVAKTAKKAPFNDSDALLSVPACAFWQTRNLMPVADPATFPKSLVVQGELDSQTAYEGGFATGTKLPGAKFIAIDNEGSHGHFPYGTECVDRPVYNYFLTGKQPSKNISVCNATPLPGETETFQSWGKIGPDGKEHPVTFSAAETDLKTLSNGKELQVGVDQDTVMQQLLKDYGLASKK